MKRLPWILGAVLLIPACDDGGGSGFVASPGVVLPAAIAPEDFKVVFGQTPVTLDGSKSWDPAGGPLTYLWEQTAGMTTALSSPTAVSPTFTAPGASETLSFRLTVTSPRGSHSDTVDVEVKKFVITTPDAWFRGYGVAGVLTATVNGAAPSPTYEWTGLEPWLTVTGGTASSTLSYTTPLLQEFQNFPDRSGVAILERSTQGRLQIKLKVTDNTGAFDEDFVNFSAGPFADSVANENVTLGEPVFLDGGLSNAALPGGAIAGWSWSLNTVPFGSTAVFRTPDTLPLAGGDSTRRWVYFVPDKPGSYTIAVTQVSASATTLKLTDLTCGAYVGVGNLTGTTPDPFKGECAACHAGQLAFVADFANPWKETGHAGMFARLLDPAHPLQSSPEHSVKGWKDAFNFGSNYSIDSRTAGWSRISAFLNGGWAERAQAEGFVMQGTTPEELVRKHPRTAGLSNVQCESCHGPGSEHAGDSTGIRKSYDTALCGRCHSRKQDLWEASSHGIAPLASAGASATGNASCTGCHTAQGFIVEMRAQRDADPHDVLFGIANLNRPVLPADERRGTTCQACHEPHQRTPGASLAGPDPQLRIAGNVRFRNAATVNAGLAAVCFMCHQSRTDTRAGSPDFMVRRAPHDSTAAEALTGTNGMEVPGWTYASSPHGIAPRFVVAGAAENRQCLTCHGDVQPNKGDVGYNAIGGHTFAMKQGSGTVIAGNGTHGAAATAGGSKILTVGQNQPSFLKSVFTGDTILLDGVPNSVASVDTARQITLLNPAGGAVTTWSVSSLPKYNTASCGQCHSPAAEFKHLARGDYDGDGDPFGPEAIQDEIAGLLAKVLSAVEAELAVQVGEPCTVLVDRGRIKYRRTASGLVRTFPGPGVTAGDNPDLSWASLADIPKGRWEKAYRAAYNRVFVLNDHSEGIHNTGYAVNLLQSSYQDLTGVAAGDPFVPY